LQIRLENTHRLIALLIAILIGMPGIGLAQRPGKLKIDVVGSFTNMRFTDEHAYGASVELWRHQGTLVGLFHFSEGLQGDTPAGLLEKVTFNATTGALSFEANLSTGVVYSKTHNGVPSRDLFRFTGVLKKGHLRGLLQRIDLLGPHAVPKPEEIVLRRESEASGMKPFADYPSWKEHVDEILKLRGPKW
jgi:hypothetical protein